MSTSVPLATASDLHSLVLLAAEEQLDENKVTPGVLGFLVFAVMGLAVWWLMRSMTRRMNAMQDKEFDRPAAGPASSDGEGQSGGTVRTEKAGSAEGARDPGA